MDDKTASDLYVAARRQVLGFKFMEVIVSPRGMSLRRLDGSEPLLFSEFRCGLAADDPMTAHTAQLVYDAGVGINPVGLSMLLPDSTRFTAIRNLANDTFDSVHKMRNPGV